MKMLMVLALSACFFSATSADVQGATQQNFDVMATMKDSVFHELDNSKHPLAIGAVALLFGLAMWYEGPKIFEALVIGSIAVVLAIIAKQSALSYWDEQKSEHKLDPSLAANVVGAEVFLVAAAAAWQGREGIMAIAGGAAGCCIASFLNSLLIAHVSPKFSMVEMSLAIYSLVSLPAAYAVFTNKHKGCLAVIAPLVGGAFISSAILFFITELLPDCKGSKKACTLPNHRKGQWVDFFSIAFQHIESTPAEKDYGIFYNSTVNVQTANGEIFGDHLFILVVWAIFWVAGYKIQMKKASESAKGREVLTEALLQHDM